MPYYEPILRRERTKRTLRGNTEVEQYRTCLAIKFKLRNEKYKLKLIENMSVKCIHFYIVKLGCTKVFLRICKFVTKK